jgi:hypothetical protein
VMAKRNPLRLKGIPPPLWGQARRALAVGDVRLFFGSASSADSMYLLLRNWVWFLAHGMAEKAMLSAWSNQKSTFHHTDAMRWLLKQIDRQKLVAAGDPLPEGDTFTLYRGVNRDGDPHGFSWTTSIDIASRFSNMFGFEGTVYSVVVPRSDVYAHLHESGRTEHEMLLLLNGDEPLRVAGVIEKRDLEAA